MCIPCILIPVLVGLISALLGYLLGKLLGKNDDELNSVKAELASTQTDRDKHLSFATSIKSDAETWKSKYDKLLLELDALKSKLTGALSDDDADKSKIAKLQAELDACNAKLKSSTSDDASDKASISKLQAELDTCNANSTKLSATIKSLEGEMGSLKLAAAAPKLIPFDAAAALAVFGKKVNQDDLKLVEGIGPKIEELFHAAGIKTWKALSETSIERCKEILDAAGERFQIHNPGTWPKQCELMYEGKWQELKEWQDKLDGGKE
jgi:predicted flap endonuclease-1-like 5' DNA nuclease